MAVPPTITRVVLEYQWQPPLPADRAANVFHVRSVLGPTPGQLAAIQTTFRGWWTDRLSPFISNKLSIVRSSAQVIRPTLGVPVEVHSSVSGASTGVVLPAQLAIVTTWRTAEAGRRKRGRTYWFGFTSAALTAGDPFSIQAGIAEAIEGASDILIDNVNATIPFEFVTYSRLNLTGEPITLAQVGSRWDTQRRRQTVALR